MSTGESKVSTWQPGSAPVAVVMISLNEGHNMDAVLQNLSGWAKEVFLVDSYSQDDTIDIALRWGVKVVQRRFRGFGDQWSFALRELPISAPWTLKLDPDERVSEELKNEILAAIDRASVNAFLINIHLFFMGRALPIRLKLLRLWKTGACEFSSVSVNEHAKVHGKIGNLTRDIEHYDSPDLDHWLEKQNRYTTAEAIIAFNKAPLAVAPNIFGSALQRRMWIKKHFYSLPFRYFIFFLYNLFWQGAWRAGWVGVTWARLRSDVMRLVEFKRREIEIIGSIPKMRFYGAGKPNSRVRQFD